MPEIEIVELPFEDVVAYRGNPRTHSRQQVRKIARSIAEFGFVNPILIDESNVIIAGHGRRLAAEQLGLSHVPTIQLRGLSDAQKRTLRIADNRLPEQSRWDEALLAEELGSLLATDLDLQLTGFDPIDLDRILTPKLSAGEDDEVLPKPPKRPVARVGDLWQCGDHLVACGDARDPDVYQKILCGRKADLVFGDPPFNVPVAGHVSGRGRTKHREFAMASGEMCASEFEAFLTTTLSLARDHSRDGALHFVCMDWRSIGRLLAVGDQLSLSLLNLCVWVKPNGGMGSLYRSQHELVAVFKHGRAPHINNVQLGRSGRYRSNVWQHPGGSSFSSVRDQDLRDHPTVKPLTLVADAIRDASKPGDLVLDPFGGSGTTLMAAETTGRKAAIIEICPAFIDVSLRRYERRTWQQPLLLPEQKPFPLVEAERLGGKEDKNV